jgi:hypothetical protein
MHATAQSHLQASDTPKPSRHDSIKSTPLPDCQLLLLLLLARLVLLLPAVLLLLARQPWSVSL